MYTAHTNKTLPHVNSECAGMLAFTAYAQNTLYNQENSAIVFLCLTSLISTVTTVMDKEMSEPQIQAVEVGFFYRPDAQSAASKHWMQ